MTQAPIITVSVLINAPIEKVWDNFINPIHIMNWNAATETWHCPKATSDFKVEGNFSYTMAAKDNSMSFEMKGTYTEIIEFKHIAYTLEDNREVTVDFRAVKNGVIVEQHFEAETENTLELQMNGWQAILDNLKLYSESN